MNLHPSKLIAHCPRCSALYPSERVVCIGERGSSALYHSHCETCEQSIIALVTESSGFVSSLGMATDLSVMDAKKFLTETPISSDQCLGLVASIHELPARLLNRS